MTLAIVTDKNNNNKHLLISNAHLSLQVTIIKLKLIVCLLRLFVTLELKLSHPNLT
jgi:hypothetical protein